MLPAGTGQISSEISAIPAIRGPIPTGILLFRIGAGSVTIAAGTHFRSDRSLALQTLHFYPLELP